jgi:hypothetical protein
MSHFTTVKTEIKDIEALRDACRELGVDLEPNAEARGYATARMRADHVIRLKGPYDIAVSGRDSKGYTLTTDWWQGHVEKEVGPQFGRLTQLYAVHKTMREARKRGHLVTRRKEKNGAVRLVIQGGGWAS